MVYKKRVSSNAGAPTERQPTERQPKSQTSRRAKVAEKVGRRNLRFRRSGAARPTSTTKRQLRPLRKRQELNFIKCHHGDQHQLQWHCRSICTPARRSDRPWSRMDSPRSAPFNRVISLLLWRHSRIVPPARHHAGSECNHFVTHRRLCSHCRVNNVVELRTHIVVVVVQIRQACQSAVPVTRSGRGTAHYLANNQVHRLGLGIEPGCCDGHCVWQQ